MSTEAAGGSRDDTIRTTVPARLDRLPWLRFHWLIVVGLGVSWILDGLEIQIVSNNGFAQEFGMTGELTWTVGFTGFIYLIGQVAGALFFGRLADSLGRKKLFVLTLAIYLAGSALAGLTPHFDNNWISIIILWVFRFIAGAGIGGEYAAINSAIDELIPSHYRGHVDIAINGTYWGGAALGAAVNALALNQDLFGESWVVQWGWRIAFLVGPVLGLLIIYLRRHIPESPRWQITHGHDREAGETVDRLESEAEREGHSLEKVGDDRALDIRPTERVPFRILAHVLFKMYPKRTLVGATMMITQSFLYNAIFFSYALALQNFYGIPNGQTPYYFFPFAIGNLVGPLLLGRLFDSVGRRKMILVTYGGSGVVLAVSAAMFQADLLNAITQTIFWSAAFFLASAGASSAYLTVSEIFPLEIRSQAISYFFSLAQIFGSLAPLIYAILIGDGSDRGPITVGYFLGSAIMLIGGIVTFIFGVDAERKQLESVTDPLTIIKREEAEESGSAGPGGDRGASGGSPH